MESPQDVIFGDWLFLVNLLYGHCMCQQSVLFYHRVVLRSTEVPPLKPSPAEGNLGCSSWAIMNKAARNIQGQVFV